MGKKLAVNVYVDDKLYVAGAEPSKSVADKITNPKAWADGGDDEQSKGYSSQNKADLQAEVDRRNEDREDDDKIVVEGNGNKPDLIKALEADDADNA